MNTLVERAKGKRLLWIDDRVSIHRALISRMESYGVQVSASETIEDGILELNSSRFDRVLLDAMLGHESSLPQIPLLLEAAGDALLSICSGFMYQDDLKKEQAAAEKETGVPIGTIEKATLPDIDEPEAIQAFLGTLFGQNAPISEESEVSLEPTSLALSYNQYARLGLEEKMIWLDEAEPLVRAVADDLFSAGYVYLLFCGSVDKPALQIHKYSEIPSEEEVIKFARNTGYAPLAVHNVGIVDDVSAACCDSSGLRSYPTLIISAIQGETEEVHFDNGASQSLMSYEWYGEKGWISYVRVPELIRAGEMRLKGSRISISPCGFKDGNGTRMDAPFTAYYIIKWEDCRLAVRCGPACQNSWAQEGKGAQICRYRTGLLGRTLPRDELKINFVVDFQSGKIQFLEP
jgi:hypothetical protein